MRPAPRLTIRRERLAELTAADLHEVGAADAESAIVASCLHPACLSDRIAACDSILRPCITHTCTR